MKNIARKMIKIYEPISGLDWLNYKLVKEDITVHHIVKKSEHGKKEIHNLALLMPISHQYLHLIECMDKKTYVALNEIFKVINMQESEPTIMQRELIEHILRVFECEHKWDKNKNGELLIKRKYIERW